VIEPIIIGHSVTGKPLEVYQFGNGPIEKMIVAGIHGGYEWNTIALADELIEYLETHPEVIPPDHTLYLLRAFNPDGYDRSRGFGGRANDNNVDLNRNFPSDWQQEWPRAGCWDYIPIEGGSSSASEPETQALMEFIDTHNIQAFISYHSAALGIFPGGQPADPGSISLAETIASVSDYPYPPIDAGCVFTGQLVDWVSDQGIPGVDIELTNHQETDFEINLAILSVFLDWKQSQYTP
jgi:murein tripeptide amidase MpaA